MSGDRYYRQERQKRRRQKMLAVKAGLEYGARALLALANRLIEWTIGLSFAALLLAAAWWLYQGA